MGNFWLDSLDTVSGSLLDITALNGSTTRRQIYEKRRVRRQAAEAVLEEQEAQFWMGVHDDEAIKQAYHKVSRESQVRANKLATENHI